MNKQQPLNTKVLFRAEVLEEPRFFKGFNSLTAELVVTTVEKKHENAQGRYRQWRIRYNNDDAMKFSSFTKGTRLDIEGIIDYNGWNANRRYRKNKDKRFHAFIEAHDMRVAPPKKKTKRTRK